MRKLPPESQVAREELGDLADWGHLPENVARLVDLMTAWLNYEYASWTADPDEVAASRSRRRKPPPFPLIPPVAARPQSLRERLSENYAAVSADFEPTPVKERLVSLEEFDAYIDEYI